jgi:Fe-S oxidoreductase
MTKLIFLGCLSSSKYLETCENAKKIINMLDSEYKVIDDAPCCGSLLYHTSTEEEIKNHVQDVYEWLKSNKITDLLTICAGCYNYLTRYYNEFIPNFDINVKHLVQLLSESDNLKKLNLKYEGKKINIAYHDPCHLRNASRPVFDEPRNLLESIKNVQFREIEKNKIFMTCCGSGGGVYSCFKESSDYHSSKIFDKAKKVRAKVLLTPCPFCYTALKRVKDGNEKIKIPIMKIEDFLIKLIERVDPLV